jgi:DNA repair protein RecO (recombination protein O)
VSSETDEAVVLRTFDYGETSQILHLFARNLGRVHGIAKGARRLKGAFRGGVDVLVLGRAQVYARRGAAELRVIGAFDVTDHLPGLREGLGRFHAANHVAALLLAFTREEQPAPDLVDLAASSLRLIASAPDADAEAAALGFEAMALGLLGFGPELSRCVVCGKPARNVVTARLSSARGGLLCTGCRREDPRAPELSGAEVRVLRDLSDGPVVRAAEIAGDPAVRRALREALDRWSEMHLDRPLRTSRRTNG